MSNENHNSKPGWKSKLEELATLPGEAMPDKNMSWEKIHARLEGRKTAKKPLWYWLAAASVLFFLMLALFVPNKRSEQLPDNAFKQMQSETKPDQSEKPASAKIKNHNKDSFTAKNPAASPKQLPVIFDKPNETAHKNITVNKKDKLRVYDTVSTKNQIAATNNNSLQAIDTSSNTSFRIPVKKRLPVVHINELGDPGNLPQIAHSSEKPTVHFLTLGNGEVYNSPAPLSKNFATINFKTSPN